MLDNVGNMHNSLAVSANAGFVNNSLAALAISSAVAGGEANAGDMNNSSAEDVKNSLVVANAGDVNNSLLPHQEDQQMPMLRE